MMHQGRRVVSEAAIRLGGRWTWSVESYRLDRRWWLCLSDLLVWGKAVWVQWILSKLELFVGLVFTLLLAMEDWYSLTTVASSLTTCGSLICRCLSLFIFFHVGRMPRLRAVPATNQTIEWLLLILLSDGKLLLSGRHDLWPHVWSSVLKRVYAKNGRIQASMIGTSSWLHLSPSGRIDIQWLQREFGLPRPSQWFDPTVHWQQHSLWSMPEVLMGSLP